MRKSVLPEQLDEEVREDYCRIGNWQWSISNCNSDTWRRIARPKAKIRPGLTILVILRP